MVRSSVVMPAISDQDTGKPHTFEKSLNKVYNMKLKLNESFLKAGSWMVRLPPYAMRTMICNLIKCTH